MNNDIQISLLFKEFLQIEHCPPEWQRLNLYLLRDENIVFYVGQSHVAFHRVWEHFYGGFKGRSLVGRFIICNWPVSMRFTVELMSSRAARFETVQNDLDLSEQFLIQLHSPCLNTALNPNPTPIPSQYESPYTSLKFRHHPQKFIRQAAQAIEAAKTREWLGQEKDSNQSER